MPGFSKSEFTDTTRIHAGRRALHRFHVDLPLLLGLIVLVAAGLLVLYSASEQDAGLVWEKHPTLTVYTGGGVDLEALSIPTGITQLLEVDDLRERYMRGLRSPSERVRMYSAQFLAEVDPYGARSMTAVEALLGDEKVRSAVDRALTEFRTRARDPAELQARHRAGVHRIHQFVFAWRYPWLEAALYVIVGVAAGLLCVTLVAVSARRWQRLREPKSEASGQTASAQ